MKTPCDQCTATKKNGDRCKRKTCKWSPFCHQHKLVDVKQSTIPNAGDGVFAKNDIKPKTVLANYKVGTTKLTKNDVVHQQDKSYIWMFSNNEYYDGKKTKSVAGSLTIVVSKTRVVKTRLRLIRMARWLQRKKFGRTKKSS